MIYLVTTEQRLFNSDNYKVIGVEESLRLLEPLQFPELDTETRGFDPYTCALLTVQLGCFDFQIVIDCTTIDITLYKDYLESDRTFLLWNAKFDLRFFFHKGIVIKNVYDGYLAEKLMWLGYPSGLHGMSLKDAGHNYLNVELDKTVRGKIQYMGLTDEVIVYAATDVKYMGKIREKQMDELKKRGLLIAIQYENKFAPILAYTEYCGVLLDVPRWKNKMKEDSRKLQEALDKLDKKVVELYPDSKWVKVNLQGDLFEGFDTTPHCCINWSSVKQVIPFFKTLGFDLTTRDKKTGETKESVEADIIESQKSKCPDIAVPYLEYKAAQKVCSTYGQNVLNQINSISGHIHTNFNQLGCDTGRLSSGGKDKSNKVEFLNFQNFPADPETRACFISGEGYTWISCDYSGQESRIIADVTADPALIDLFNNGCGDVHSLTAKMSYPDVIKDCPVEEVKSKFKHYRQEAKGIE